MRETKQFLSRTERAYVGSVAVLTSLLCLANFAVTAVYPILYPQPIPIYDMVRASLFPFHQLLIIPLPVLLYRARRFFVPAILTAISLVPAYVEFAWGYSAILANSESLKNSNSLQILLMIAKPLDYMTFVLGNILLVWICSIVIRSFTSTEVANAPLDSTTD